MTILLSPREEPKLPPLIVIFSPDLRLAGVTELMYGEVTRKYFPVLVPFCVTTFRMPGLAPVGTLRRISVLLHEI